MSLSTVGVFFVIQVFFIAFDIIICTWTNLKPFVVPEEHIIYVNILKLLN